MYKFLLDENLSLRLTRALVEFGEVRHVSEKGLMENNDNDIWQFQNKMDLLLSPKTTILNI